MLEDSSTPTDVIGQKPPQGESPFPPYFNQDGLEKCYTDFTLFCSQEGILSISSSEQLNEYLEQVVTQFNRLTPEETYSELNRWSSILESACELIPPAKQYLSAQYDVEDTPYHQRYKLPNINERLVEPEDLPFDNEATTANQSLKEFEKNARKYSMIDQIAIVSYLNRNLIDRFAPIFGNDILSNKPVISVYGFRIPFDALEQYTRNLPEPINSWIKNNLLRVINGIPNSPHSISEDPDYHSVIVWAWNNVVPQEERDEELLSKYERSYLECQNNRSKVQSEDVKAANNYYHIAGNRDYPFFLNLDTSPAMTSARANSASLEQEKNESSKPLRQQILTDLLEVFKKTKQRIHPRVEQALWQLAINIIIPERNTMPYLEWDHLKNSTPARNPINSLADDTDRLLDFSKKTGLKSN